MKRFGYNLGILFLVTATATLLVSHLDIAAATPTCNNNLRGRIDCGWTGITPEICQQIGCCSDTLKNGTGMHHCYIGQGGKFTSEDEDDECNFSNPLNNRVNCGFSGISKQECESLHCCYDSRVSGAYNCFFSDGVSKKPDSSQLSSFESKTNTMLSKFRSLKDRILTAHRDYNIAKTVGNSASIGGTLAIVGGIFAAPFTGGLSLGLTIGGIVTTVAGGATTVTTTIIEGNKAKEWAEELMKPMGDMESAWREMMVTIVTHPAWRRLGKNFHNLQSAVEKTFAPVALARVAAPLPTKISGIESTGSVFKVVDTTNLAVQGGVVTVGTVSGVTASLAGVGGSAAATGAGIGATTSGATTTFLAGWTAGYGPAVASPFVLASGGGSAAAASASGTTVVASTGAATGSAAVGTGAAVLSVGGAVLGVVSIGLNVYSIVDTWSSSPQMAEEIDNVVVVWTDILSELKQFCSEAPEACDKTSREKRREKKCKRNKDDILSLGRRSRRATHLMMGEATCNDVGTAYDQRYTQANSWTLGAGTPIDFVGYKTVHRPGRHPTNVVTNIHAEIRRLNENRLDFAGNEWGDVMRELGARIGERGIGDERGHLLASQFFGPVAWYNLAPQSPRINRNVGNAGNAGWFPLERLIARHVRNGCGWVNYFIYLNYGRFDSVRPKGFKICLEFFTNIDRVVGALMLNQYFDNTNQVFGIDRADDEANF